MSQVSLKSSSHFYPLDTLILTPAPRANPDEVYSSGHVSQEHSVYGLHICKWSMMEAAWKGGDIWV